MARHIDLYVAHNLDRQQAPAELAQRLTTQLGDTAPQDSMTRGRVERARAIIGDPQRRAAYDAQRGAR